MRTDVHASALRAAAKIALSLAFLEGCGGATAPVETRTVDPVDPVTGSSDPTTPPSAPGSGTVGTTPPVVPPANSPPNPSCEAVLDAAFPGEDQYPGKKQAVSTEVQTCCVQTLSNTNVPDAHHWDCCANRPENAPENLQIACTPWGPPVPPSMKRRVLREVA